MSKQTPAGAAARGAALTAGIVVAAALAILAYFGLLEFNAWLAQIITSKERGYGVAAVFISLIGLEVAIVVGAFMAVKAYRSALND